MVKTRRLGTSPPRHIHSRRGFHPGGHPFHFSTFSFYFFFVFPWNPNSHQKTPFVCLARTNYAVIRLRTNFHIMFLKVKWNINNWSDVPGKSRTEDIDGWPTPHFCQKRAFLCLTRTNYAVIRLGCKFHIIFLKVNWNLNNWIVVPEKSRTEDMDGWPTHHFNPKNGICLFV